ncbi:MAG: S41 family peptidase [Bacteroidota bacterium]
MRSPINRLLQLGGTLFLALIFMVPTIHAQDNQVFARFPAVSPDGEQVAFSYQGDIWVSDIEGGRAYRLTIHEAYEAHPKWSPDGSQIAFTSDRYGNDDLFVLSLDGGEPKRLTYHSAGDDLSSWNADGRLMFTTQRMFNQVEWDPEIHAISSTGGTPQRVLDSFGHMPTMSPDGRFIVFVRGYNREYRKHYRGSANKDIWIYDTRNDGYQQLTSFKGNDMYPQFAGEALYFISERNNRTHNLYRMRISADGKQDGEVEQLTSFEGDGVRYFGISDDGSNVVFERKTGLYTLDTQSGAINPLNINVTQDDRFYQVEMKTYSSDVDEFAVSPSEDYLAMVIRGDLFFKQNKDDKQRTVQLTKHPFRDRDVTFLNDSTLIFSSDREGQYELYKMTSADPEEPNLFFTLKYDVERLTNSKLDERDPVIAPNGKQIAFNRGRGQLIVADISESGMLSNETVLLDGWATAEDVSWSPDSKWLAYALADLDFNTEIYIHAADNSREPVNISMHPRADYSPVWSGDGSKLGFISTRNNGDSDIWFAWLNKEDWEKTELDRELEEARAPKKENDTNGEEESVPPVEIDFDDLYKRLTQVTAMPGNESDLAISKDGETFYFVTNRNSRQRFDADQDLFSVKWDGSERKPLTSENQAPYNVFLGSQGATLYMLKRGGTMFAFQTGNGKLQPRPFRAQKQIDYQAERNQVFEEAWRSLYHGFYDPEFHGVDWTAMHEKYKPWAMKASTNRDFRDVFNMMLGEVNASHMGIYGSDRSETQRNRTGLLGVEITPVENGVRVDRVVPGSPADRQRSKLQIGDVITAVDGQSVAVDNNFYQLIENKVDERTILSVQNNGQSREVIIQPTGSLGDQLYEEWVENRKQLVDEYSNGRLGYIHVEGMNWPSFERFERELVASGHGKDGLIIDVRYNGGGWTTDYLMTVLSVQQHAYTIPRGATDDLEEEQKEYREHYPFGERLPLSSWTKPAIALSNENSYSNAEIFSHAFKTLNHGTLVGQPTFGAVISTGGVGLMDGSYVRLPFRGWYVKATDENMEHGPAVPDILIENAPDYRGQKTDAQLKKAVDELLSQIDGR